MKKLIALFLALVCALSFVACSANDVNNSKLQAETNNITANTETNDTSYKITIADNYPIENSLKSAYEAGEQITIKLPTVTEGYYVVYVNGVRQDKDRDASDSIYTYYSFIMPREDVLIEIEDHWVDIPEEPPETPVADVENMRGESPRYKNMDAFASAADAIIVGEITNITCEQIDKVEKGLVESSGPVITNLTRYTVTVNEVITGNLNEGTTIIIDQTGGLSGDVNMVVEGTSYMEMSNEYLLFLRQPEVAQGKGYCENMLLTVNEGFCRISEGKVIPLEKNNLISEPTAYSEVKSIVQKSVK